MVLLAVPVRHEVVYLAVEVTSEEFNAEDGLVQVDFINYFITGLGCRWTLFGSAH